MFLSSITLVAAVALAPAQQATAPPQHSIHPTQDVLLVRDLSGTPHVYASTDEGAYFGAGYAAAQDRFFQMSLRRLIYQGRVAEFLGPGTVGNVDKHVESDRKFRILGVERYARGAVINMDAETRDLLQAYADGVNAAIAAPDFTPHPFFAQEGVPLEPWTAKDCVGVWYVLGQFFQPSGLDEAKRLHDFEDLIAQGYTVQEAIDELTGDIQCDEEAAAVLQSDVPAATQQAMQDFATQYGLSGGNCPTGTADFKFSHAWAVAGNRTTTGRAALVGDPRVTVYAPNFFYEFSMQGATFATSGCGFAGTPNLLVGRTAHTAWSPTAIGTDMADLYEITTDPLNHPGQYFVDGAWKNFRFDVTETILVEGRASETVQYRSTEFGPLVTALAADVEAGEEFALKQIPLSVQGPDAATGFLAMMRAQNVQELFAGAGQWLFPSVNLILADAQGEVGYVANGGLPVRNPAAILPGIMAQDGTSSANHWPTLVPQELKPHVFNPAQGFVYSANHMPVGAWYPIPVRYGQGSHGDGSRSRRLRERLQARAQFTPQDVYDIHFDVTNPARRDFVYLGLYLRDRQGYPLSQAALDALTHLQPWFTAGATMDNQHYATFLASRMNLMFRVSNVGQLAEIFGGGENGLHLFQKTMVDKARTSQNLSTLEADYIDKVLRDAYNLAIGQAPVNRWQQEYLENAQNFEAPVWISLHGFPSLDPQTTWSGFVTTGDGGTLLSPRGQSYTQFVEVGTQRAQSILPPGIAEIGPHAFDQQAAWEQELLKDAPWSLYRVMQLGIESVTFLDF